MCTHEQVEKIEYSFAGDFIRVLYFSDRTVKTVLYQEIKAYQCYKNRLHDSCNTNKTGHIYMYTIYHENMKTDLSITITEFISLSNIQQQANISLKMQNKNTKACIHKHSYT